MFFPLLKTVFELVDFDAFQCFCRFLFHVSHVNKTFLFEDFFHPGKQKKCHSGRDHVTREGGAWGHAGFGQKLQNTQCGVGRCAHKSPIVKWTNTLKESSKKIHWSQTQPLTTTPAGTRIQMGS